MDELPTENQNKTFMEQSCYIPRISGSKEKVKKLFPYFNFFCQDVVQIFPYSIYLYITLVSPLIYCPYKKMGGIQWEI